jgi:hypothetical protein
MARGEVGRLDAARVCERFTDDREVVNRLIDENETFRSICEDYVLAQRALTEFKKKSDHPDRPEVADYQSVICELEQEIRGYVRAEK